MHSTPNIRWIADLSLADRATVGGKGASLGELTRANIAVPPGFVVTTQAFERFIAEVEQEHSIRSRVEALRDHDLNEISAFSEQVRAWFGRVPFPEDICAEIVA